MVSLQRGLPPGKDTRVPRAAPRACGMSVGVLDFRSKRLHPVLYTFMTATSDRSGSSSSPNGAPSTLPHGEGVRVPPRDAPYYVPLANEIEIFERCHQRGLPVMLKGPTGSGKTRFVEHMSWKLQRPLVTVACHDDLSASDL